MMHKNLSGVAFSLLGSLTVSGILIFSHNQALAQVTPDNTLGDESSVVNPRDATSESIDGGAVRGQNLFHSFEEFNVGENRGIYFANPDAVTNIFSRVTGGNVSNILGTLGVDGAANLFLINPNGIVFGEDASLDVQGSFAATTADGIEFGSQGFFSASDPESPSLLTINPSAYLFNQVTPGAIANSSKATADFNPATSFDDNFFGLRVPDGQSLLLIGGDLNFDGGGLVASGGRIELGAIAGEGIVGLNENGSLNISDSISRGDVSLTNGAGFLVAGDGGGDLAIAAKDISLNSASTIEAGIDHNSNSSNAQAGDINLNATGTISVKDYDSLVYNSINAGATGKAGNLTIDTNNLTISDGGQIFTAIFGQGDAGNLVVRAANVELQGTSSDGEFYSGLFTTIESQAQGNGGDLTINTDNLSLGDRAQISASTFSQGDSGNIAITADDSISLDASSYIVNNVQDTNAVGDAGKIDITTGSLSATNGSQINSFTRGQGNAGDITIKARNTVTFDGVDSNGDNSGLTSSVEAGGEGNGGNINITAGSLSLTNAGFLEVGVREALESDSLPGGKGQGGNVKINVDDTVTIADGGYISSSTLGQGDSGNINITANNAISLDDSSYIVNNVQSIDAVGDAGTIEITTGSLSATNGSQINSFTRGQGNAGDITIQATDEVIFDGVSNDGDYSGSASNVAAGGVGNGGNIKITTPSLSLTNGAEIDASIRAASDSLSDGQGKGGNIDIQVGDLIIRDGGLITSSTLGKGNSGKISITADNAISLDANSKIVNNVEDVNAVGDAGTISITTGSLSATNVSQINSFTRGKGNAGDITIQATDAVTFDGFNNDDNYSSVFSSVEAGGDGDGGNIKITTPSLSITNGGQLNVSVREPLETLPGGQGKGGNIDIQIGDLIIRDGGLITSSTLGKGNSGNITITADNAISLDASSYISNNVEDINAVGNAGKIDITTGSLTNDGLISSGTLGKGNAGTIDITTGLLTNDGFINSSTFGKGNAGDITIKATDTVTFDGFDDNYGSILSSVDSDAVGKGGNIDIQAGNLVIKNGGVITSSTLGEGDSGNISITISSLYATNGGVINSGTAGQGNAGNITIQATETVTFDGFDGNFNSSAFSSVKAGGVGNGGDINIKARSLSLTNGGQLEASTFGEGDSGNISITADNAISLDASSYIVNNVQSIDAVGDAGKIDITTGSLSATNGSQINSFTRGQGNAGDITIQATDAVTFDGVDGNDNYSGSFSNVVAGGVGNGGNIKITAGSLSLTNAGFLEAGVNEALDADSLPGGKGQGGNININVDDTLTIAGGGYITASTLGEGDSGNLFISANNLISLDSSSYISNNVQSIDAVGDAGKIDITTGSLSATNGSQINSFTRGQGNAGKITIQAADSITFDGVNSNNNSSGSFSSVEPGGVGNGGDINITTRFLSLTNEAKLSASVYEEKIATNKETTGNAGSINLIISDILEANNGEISTSSNQSSGGEINITSGEINLRGDSNIRSNIFSGAGGGGNINITADSVIAFDDSDIFAFARDGRGGNISLDTPAFFAENFTLNSLTADPETLNNNSRADVNATGAVSGSVAIPDVSFIQNSLTELENNAINTDELVANSCVVPVGQRKQGKFIITGAESLPVRPGDGMPSKYPTGKVRNVPESNHSSWQPGDPIVEPQGAYRLANGKLVLSRQCSQ